MIPIERPGAVFQQFMLSIDAVPEPLLACGQRRIGALDDLVGCRVIVVVVAAGEEVVDLDAHFCCVFVFSFLGLVWGGSTL